MDVVEEDGEAWVDSSMLALVTLEFVLGLGDEVRLGREDAGDDADVEEASNTESESTSESRPSSEFEPVSDGDLFPGVDSTWVLEN